MQWTLCLIVHPGKLEVFALMDGKKAEPEIRLVEDGPAFGVCEESVTVLGKPMFYGDSRVSTQDRLLEAWSAVLQGIDSRGFYDPQKLVLADLALSSLSSQTLDRVVQPHDLPVLGSSRVQVRHPTLPLQPALFTA